MRVEVDLTNTGARTGTEVVQLYISDVVTSFTWACKELKLFRRVTLEPGETRRVAFDLPVDSCTIVNGDAERIVEPGEFKVLGIRAATRICGKRRSPWWNECVSMPASALSQR